MEVQLDAADVGSIHRPDLPVDVVERAGSNDDDFSEHADSLLACYRPGSHAVFERESSNPK
jgi:hypothetical protein